MRKFLLLALVLTLPVAAAQNTVGSYHSHVMPISLSFKQTLSGKEKVATCLQVMRDAFKKVGVVSESSGSGNSFGFMAIQNGVYQKKYIVVATCHEKNPVATVTIVNPLNDKDPADLVIKLLNVFN